MRLNKKKMLVQLAERCMNQVDLAKAYGCKKQYIYTLIHNHPTNPKVIGRIAKAIGCRAVDIIDMEEDK